MENIFLDHYTLSGALTFEGVFKHYEAYSQETKWNKHAIIHLSLTCVHSIPLISQIWYIVEACLACFFTTETEPLIPRRIRTMQSMSQTPLPSLSSPEKKSNTISSSVSKVELTPGTLFGTKNQYTDTREEKERQSCSVQALTFLKSLFKHPVVSPSMIDHCLQKGLQTFQKLSDDAQVKRRSDARNYLIKQGVPGDAVDQFLRENPGVPKEWPLMQFLSHYPHVATLTSQLLSGHALTAKEAFVAFKNDMKIASDTSHTLDVNEAERQVFFLPHLPPTEMGTVLTCNGLTVLIANLDNHYLIYDPHGNTNEHNGNAAAYVKIMKTREGAATYLASLFDYREGGTNQLELMTLQKLSLN